MQLCMGKIETARLLLTMHLHICGDFFNSKIMHTSQITVQINISLCIMEFGHWSRFKLNTILTLHLTTTIWSVSLMAFKLCSFKLFTK